MFNEKKQEITMKKYIAPVAKSIYLYAENELLANSIVNGEGNGIEFSNQRQRSASSVIWGFDDGVVVEDEY